MARNESKQAFEAWDPDLPGAGEVSVDALIDDWEGFRILLRNHKTNGVIRIAFDTHLAYQSRDESDFAGEAARSEGLGRACLYRVRNSEFLGRFLMDTARRFSPTHFAIITGDQCVDVIAESGPRVENLKDVARERAARAMERQTSLADKSGN
jgi:hypothetical protein